MSPGPKFRPAAAVFTPHRAERRGGSPALVRATDQFNGAELEEVIVSALYEAFAESTGKEEEPQLSDRHLLRAATQINPLARSRQQDIENLRAWAEKNCRPAGRAMQAEADAPQPSESLVEKQARLLDLDE